VSSCTSSGDRSVVEITLYSDGTCVVWDESIERSELAALIRKKVDWNPRLALATVVVNLPWDADEEQCEKQRVEISALLERLGLGSRMRFQQASHPVVVFLVSVLPYLALIAAGGGYYYWRKRRNRPAIT
jgi:hypothetical protein